jgi:hypothetical protein
MKDFEQEIIGYKNNLNLVDSLIKSSELIGNFIPERASEAFRLYRKHFV